MIGQECLCGARPDDIEPAKYGCGSFYVCDVFMPSPMCLERQLRVANAKIDEACQVLWKLDQITGQTQVNAQDDAIRKIKDILGA